MRSFFLPLFFLLGFPCISLSLQWRLCSRQVEGSRSLRMHRANQDGDFATTTFNKDSFSNLSVSRRKALVQGVSAALGTGSALVVGASASADEEKPFTDVMGYYVQAKRPTAYRVDTTIPPTLNGLQDGKDLSILKGLGRGSGTFKGCLLDQKLNTNNMMNKFVYSTINGLKSAFGALEDDASERGPGYATFVCLGVPRETNPTDIELALGVLEPIVATRPRGKETGLGIALFPISTQGALDSFTRGERDEQGLEESLKASGVNEATFSLYLPLMRYAKERSLRLLALSPELEDIRVVRTEGLQNLDGDRRGNYVLDAQGFIALTQDKRFRMYTDRSLQKDFVALNDKDTSGDFFAERILVHETGATVAAKYANSRPDSLVAIVAPTPDLRYMEGINGRIPRIMRYILGNESKVREESVTTILLNPTPKETLSLGPKLRLEIGTAPENVDVQTKVSDYLWFSKMPKVSVIPRLMSD